MVYFLNAKRLSTSELNSVTVNFVEALNSAVESVIRQISIRIGLVMIKAFCCNVAIKKEDTGTGL
mgnify:CR=1 FL=1